MNVKNVINLIFKSFINKLKLKMRLLYRYNIIVNFNLTNMLTFITFTWYIRVLILQNSILKCSSLYN